MRIEQHLDGRGAEPLAEQLAQRRCAPRSAAVDEEQRALVGTRNDVAAGSRNQLQAVAQLRDGERRRGLLRAKHARSANHRRGDADTADQAYELAATPLHNQPLCHAVIALHIRHLASQMIRP